MIASSSPFALPLVTPLDVIVPKFFIDPTNNTSITMRAAIIIAALCALVCVVAVEAVSQQETGSAAAGNSEAGQRPSPLSHSASHAPPVHARTATGSMP